MSANRHYTNRRYLDAIADHIVIFDGAMGTSIDTYHLTAADFGGERTAGCNDYLTITRPDVIRAIHESFLDVGSEVVETNTFRGNRLTLGEYGLGERVLEINRAAARLARAACDDYEAQTGLPRFVAGSMGPSGKLPSGNDPDLSDITFDALAELFREQAQGLIEGGADLLLIETSQDILEVKAAVHGIQAAFADTGQRIPVQAQVTLDTTGRMLFGTDIASALTTLEALPIDVIGLNCSTGPEHMRQPVNYLVEHSTLPISVLPNAGLPINVEGEAVFPMQPDPFSEMVSEFTPLGVNVVGGCCGTTPAHLRKLVQAVHGERGAAGERQPPVTRQPETIAAASSGMKAARLAQDPGPTLIGERVNSQGSRRMKRLLLDEDYDAIVAIAEEQVGNGAHMLDVCVALTERDDEKEQMRALVKKLAMAIDVPLIIDTTEAEVAEAALALYPGRAVINGNNLENGRARIDSILPIAVKHGAAVLSMTIDEQGMAHDRERKFAIAERITRIAQEDYGLPRDALIFDPLTFPLTTGQPELRRDAIETLESIRLIKADLPGALTVLGISNVSFGVGEAARAVLNSVFLYHAVQAGLDMAIVNPAHITPYAEIPAEQRALADDLIFDRDENALARFIQYFEQNAVALTDHSQADPTIGMAAEEALGWSIVHRRKEGVEALIDDSLTRQDAVGVLNNVLLPAMKEVGDKFGAGELILPFVLQSAEVMKKAVAYLEGFMERREGSSKGVFVLATVYGDVHDIGKNLVKTILANNGYTVQDLGKQVPVNTIVEQAVAHGADAIGLSALLVSTSKQMPLVVNELARRGLAIPVLIGGAAINRRFGQRIAFVGDSGEAYAGGVYYCNDAFEGLDVMNALMDPDQRAAFAERRLAEAIATRDAPERPSRPTRAGAGRSVAPAPDLPQPPFWGTRIMEYMPLELVLANLHKPELFRLSWGAKNTQGEAWEALEAQFEERLAHMTRTAVRDKSLLPQAIYGYFPANSDGDDLIFWQPEAYAERGERVEVGRMAFPRQPDGERLCIADYYAPASEAAVDVAVLQVATAGAAATDRFEALQGDDAYSEAYFFHGLAVQTAEAAAANVVTAHVRQELGLAPDRGKRYSWGYPACPDLEDHALVWALMPRVASELGLALTESYQIVPEQSTAAIYAHHPAAKYYSVGALDRSAQILGNR